MNYSQLSQQQRYKIQSLYEQGYNPSAIAEQVGKHRSSIYRELKRNPSKSGYKAQNAQKMAETRRQNRGNYKIKDRLEQYIHQALAKFWSPEQIAGRAQVEQQEMVSIEAIYQYIYRDHKQGGKLANYLRQKRKKRHKRLASNKKRGQIPNRVDIDERPQVVEENTELGHWEADTVVLAAHQGSIVTLVERKTKFLITALLPNRETQSVIDAVIQRLNYQSLPVKSITYDNGKEFTDHQRANKSLGCESYFCKPYHSWERGLNENTNGLLRQYIPKGQKLKDTNWKALRSATLAINHRPRKCLNFLSSYEYIEGILK